MEYSEIARLGGRRLIERHNVQDLTWNEVILLMNECCEWVEAAEDAFMGTKTWNELERLKSLAKISSLVV